MENNKHLAKKESTPTKRARERKKVKPIVFIVLLAVCICVLGFSAFKIYEIIREWNKGTQSYNKVTEDYVTEVVGGEEPEINFTELQDDHPATTSWIRIEGTRIDYPVAQWTDNDYYLNHLLDGTRNNNGTIFMDYRNNKDLTDRNTFIYGHHMKNGSMFAELVKYKDQAYYEEHPVVEYITPEKKFKAEIFSAQVCSATSDVFTLEFKNDAAFGKYLKKMQNASMIDSDVTVTETDRILTLMTCTYEYDDARFVVHAKLTEIE